MASTLLTFQRKDPRPKTESGRRCYTIQEKLNNSKKNKYEYKSTCRSG